MKSLKPAGALAAFLLALSSLSAATAERWKGKVDLPTGPLEFTVLIGVDAETGKAGAKIDIPAQGAMGLGLVDVVDTGEKIAFTIGPVGAEFSFVPSEDGASAEGKLDQSGMTFTASMQRLTEEEVEEARAGRPQEPKAPFPYAQWEVKYENPADGAKFAGTLTVPEGRGPFPAAILITGSGAQDRDESLVGHRPFAVIADHLSRNGIAVLRSDDRGVGGSSGGKEHPLTVDFASDVAAAAGFLKQFQTIDSAKIGLIGHSEGGLIAPMVAAKDPSIAFAVLLAGTGVNGREILREQVKAMSMAAGLPEEAANLQVAQQQELLGMVVDGKSDEELRSATMRIVKAQMEAQGMSDSISEQALEQTVTAQLASITSPWMRAFLTLDPGPSLRKTTCPILALNGSLDTQVLATQNLPEIKKALERAGNTDVTIKEIPGLNHLFQHATTGAFSEYAQIEETISPEVLELMTSWIQERMSRPAQG
jgi:alpha-beta hydrolase superfamily lysophospholipase